MNKKGGNVTADIVSKTQRILRSAAFLESRTVVNFTPSNHPTLPIGQFRAKPARAFYRKERTAGSLN